MRRIRISTALGQKDVLTACAEAQQLAENEHLSEAEMALGEIWRGPLTYPVIPDSTAKAEILSVVGDLSSRIGHEQHIPGSQEHAKNLLSEAISILQSNSQDSSDAQIRLALTYLREGSYEECRIVLDETVLSEELKAKEALIRAILHYRAGEPQLALLALNGAEALFDPIGGTLRGKFHLERGILLKDLRETDRAIIELQAATTYFEDADNQRFLLAVRVALAELLIDMDEAQALENIDFALRSAKTLESKNTVASCSETKARILIKSGRLSEAKRAILDAVGIFRQGDEHSLHSEALVTQGRIWAKLGLDARPIFDLALSEAELGDVFGVANACMAMLEELSLSVNEVRDLYNKADAALRDTERQDALLRLRNCARRFTTYVPSTFQEIKLMALGNEARAIDAALEKTGGSVRAAAKLLGTTHGLVRYHLLQNPNSKAKRNAASKKSIIK